MNQNKIGGLIKRINDHQDERRSLTELLDRVHTGRGIGGNIGKVALVITHGNGNTNRLELELAKAEKKWNDRWEGECKLVAGMDMLLLGVKKYLQGQIDVLDDRIAKAKAELAAEVVS